MVCHSFGKHPFGQFFSFPLLFISVLFCFGWFASYILFFSLINFLKIIKAQIYGRKQNARTLNKHQIHSFVNDVMAIIDELAFSNQTIDNPFFSFSTFPLANKKF